MSFLHVLGIKHETAHTKLLAWLLDPNADHGLGSEFLKGFCRLALGKDIDLAGAVVDAECVQIESRPDIVVRTARHYIAVENKTHECAFRESQIAKHIRGARRLCNSDGSSPFIVLLIPDRERAGAPDFSASLPHCDRQRLDWRQVIALLNRVSTAAPKDAHARAFIPVYVDYVEREVLKMWKGFDSKILDDETVNAAARYIPRQQAIREQMAAFADAVQSNLSSRRRRLHGTDGREEYSADAPEPCIFSRGWWLSKSRRDKVWVSLFCKPAATKHSDLRLYIEMHISDPHMIEATERAGWRSVGKARQLFGPSTVVGGGGGVYLYTRLPRSRWYATSARASDAAVKYVRDQLERYWDRYDSIHGVKT
jgi:hypothetical protein